MAEYEAAQMVESSPPSPAFESASVCSDVHVYVHVYVVVGMQLGRQQEQTL